MKIFYSSVSLTFLFTIIRFASIAQVQPDTLHTEVEDIYTLSLEDLMNIPITVASKSALTQRESPAIVSVITREEIINMGARDVMDILNQIPGFSFGLDVQNVVGVGSRGNWGHEGKVLVLLDGLEMNEILFSSTQFGQHFDPMQIERIEIIRGPGSSIYGGYAELGVINIITQNGNKLKGIRVSGTTGFTGDASVINQASIGIGKGNEDFDYSIAAFVGKGKRSDQIFNDAYGNTIDLTNNSGLNSTMLNARLRYKGLSARIIYDGYSVETADQFGEITSPLDKVRFNNTFMEIKYDYKINDKLTITPRIGYKTGTPWKSNEDSPIPYDIQANRLAPNITVNWSLKNATLVGGIDSYFDNAKYKGNNPTPYFVDSNEVTYSNIGVFAQGLITTKIVNITLGARVDNHSQFGSAFSPRIGFTKVINDFHFKILYNRAFRAPAIENIRTNADIKPERTGVAEIEVGYKLNSNMVLTGSIYDITINDPIVFYVTTEFPTGAYQNFDKGGSRGFEIEWKLKYNWGYITTNYSYYSAKDKNKVALYAVPTDEKTVLAFPTGRLNINSSFRVGKKLSISPSFNILGSRYAQTGIDINEVPTFSKFNPSAYINLYLNYINLFTEGLSIGIGVYDIADKGQLFIQPYASDHVPLPGIGRQYLVRLNYSLGFK